MIVETVLFEILKEKFRRKQQEGGGGTLVEIVHRNRCPFRSFVRTPHYQPPLPVSIAPQYASSYVQHVVAHDFHHVIVHNYRIVSLECIQIHLNLLALELFF